jgi:hypothetical protein
LTIEVTAAVVSALIALVVAAGGLVGWYLSRRTEQLRRDDVLAWALSAIEALQTIVIICRQAGKRLPIEHAEKRMEGLVISTSVLIEQGRLYFTNVPSGDFGLDKPAAYRGLRPRMLDYLVVAHQVACHWPNAGDAERLKMGFLVEDATRHFVSTVQKEVGRDRTAFSGASEHGYGVYLPHLLSQVDETKLTNRGWG